MIEFRCPYCDRRLRGGNASAGKEIPCPQCEGLFTVPKRGGEPAEIVLCPVVLRAPTLPLSGVGLPKVCIGCGRDAPGLPERVVVMSHRRASLEDRVAKWLGRKLLSAALAEVGELIAEVAVDAPDAAGEAGRVGASVGKELGARAFEVFNPAREAPFPLFTSVPLCDRCSDEDTETVELVGRKGVFVVVGGVPSRFAVAARRMREQEAEGFEQGLSGDAAPGGNAGAGFDWTSLE